MADPHGPDHGPGPGSEHGSGQGSDQGGFDHELPIRPILHAGIWTAAICAFAFVAVIPLYRWMAAAERQADPAASPIAEAAVHQLPPEPRLQPVPERDLAALRQEQETLLGSYGWVDRQAGIARIPIDRAIDLMAQRGLAARVPPVPTGVATAADTGNSR